MRPVNIFLENFMSYKTASLKLEGVDMAAIVGQNGAGKSTILQAITYALWGQVRTASHNDVVRRGASECVVQLTFDVGDHRYILTRKRNLSGRGGSYLAFTNIPKLDDIDRVHVVLTKPTIKETQEEIDRVVGMSYNVFANSVLLQQGEASKFSDAAPAERKKLLGELIGLETFQEIESKARTQLSTDNAKAQKIAVQLGDIEEELRDLDGAEDKYKNSIALQETLIAKKEEKKAELEKAQKRLGALKDLTAQFDDAQDKWDIINQQRMVIQDLIGQRMKVVDDCEKITAQKEEVIEAVEQKDILSQRLADLETLKVLDAEWKERHKLSMDRAKIVSGMDTLHDQSARILGQITTMTERLECERKERDQHDREIFREDGMCNGFDLLLKEFLRHTEHHCPLCQQIVGDPQAFVNDIQDEIYKRHIIVDGMMEEAEKFTAIVDRDEELLKRLNLQREDVERQLSAKQAQVAMIDDEMTKFKITVKPAYNDEEHVGVVEKLNRVADSPLALSEIKSAEKRHKEAEEEIADLVKKLDESTASQRGIYSKIRKLELVLADCDDQIVLEDGIEILEARLDGIEQNLADAIERTAQTRWAMERTISLEEKFDVLEIQAAKLDERVGLLDLVVQASSKTGAQALLIEAALPDIEKDANGFLELMSPNMSLAFESQRTTLKGTASETLDIRVIMDGQDAPIETLSGGERFRADLAIRLAIGKLLTRRSGAKADMLAIDEGFGSQDNDGLESVVETLQTLRGVFPLIVVITHVEKMVPDFEHVIRVEKKGGISCLRQ